MRCVLVLENQLVEQAIHIWIEQAGIVGGCTRRFRIGRLDSSGYQLLHLTREVLEEPLNDGTVAPLVWWAKHEVDGVVDPITREHPCQILQAVRMVRPGIVQKQLQRDTRTAPFLLDSLFEM